MAKSRRRLPSSTGGARPDTSRRQFHVPKPGGSVPPIGGPTTRAPGPPRPLTPARDSKPGVLATVGAQRLVIGAVTIVVLIAVGLLAYAWWANTLRPRTELALRVGDRSYNMEYFAKRFRATVENPPPGTDVQTGLLTTLPDATRSTIETESITLQRAGTLGVTASDAEIDRDLVLKKLGIPVVLPNAGDGSQDPNAPFAVTPVMESTLRGQLQRERLTLAQYREIVQADVLRRKVGEYFVEQAPRRGPQARVRLIQLPNESDARIAIGKIRSGESTLAELADTVSLDAAGKGRGGLRDWLPKGVLPKPVDDVVFSSLPIGQLSEPIDSGVENAWVVLQVEERADERDISDDVRRQLGQRATEAWYTEQKASLAITYAVTETKLRWAVEFAPPNLAGLSGAGGSGLPAGVPQNINIPGTSPAQPPAGQP